MFAFERECAISALGAALSDPLRPPVGYHGVADSTCAAITCDKAVKELKSCHQMEQSNELPCLQEISSTIPMHAAADQVEVCRRSPNACLNAKRVAGALACWFSVAFHCLSSLPQFLNAYAGRGRPGLCSHNLHRGCEGAQGLR